MSQRRRGQWDRSESYFNEAERLDPRNVHLLTQHATTDIALRRFPEALRKLDQVLDITPDDVDTLVTRRLSHKPRAICRVLLRSSLRSIRVPTTPGPLETQVYQAILERRPAPVISRLKEILAKPDPALGYINGELRFWLGWAQEVAGDHAAAQESWRQARSELEPFLKEQPDNYSLIGDLALTNMGLGDKAAALALSERAMAVNPIEKDAIDGPLVRSRSSHGWRRRWESPTAPSPLYRNYFRYRTRARWLGAAAHSRATPARSDVRSAPE